MSITLNNGVVVPDLPTEVLAEGVYLTIVSTLNADTAEVIPDCYTLIASAEKLVYAPEMFDVLGLGVGAVIPSCDEKPRTFLYNFDFGGSNWVSGAYLPVALDGDVQWANYDILTMTGLDEEAETPIIGTEVYFANSEGGGTVNPDPEPEGDMLAVTREWLENMAGHTKRFSNTTGKFTPEEMDDFFCNATLEELYVTPDSTEQTFTPESPCIGFSKVIVDAADSGGGGDILPDDGGEDYPDAEDVNFGTTISGADLYTGKYFYGRYPKAINIPEVDTNIYPNMVLTASNNVLTLLVSSEKIHWTTPYAGDTATSYSAKYLVYKYDETNSTWTIAEQAEEATVNVHLAYIYWANPPIAHINNPNNYYSEPDSIVCSEPVPETVAGAEIEYIQTAETYTISGATLNALGAVTQQITGVAASTPSAMVAALQMYAATH